MIIFDLDTKVIKEREGHHYSIFVAGFPIAIELRQNI